MYPEAAGVYAREKGLSIKESAQTFMQVAALRHLSDPLARFMGGTALVLGYGNPDVDLTQVSDPQNLKAGLIRARAELEGWFQSPVTLLAPERGGRTWRLTIRMGRAESVRLHIDSQKFAAHTSRPLVITYPSIPPFVCEALEIDEIMAEKIIAVACRRYLGGRDLFDLWFHWLRSEDWMSRSRLIFEFVERKMRERSLKGGEFWPLFKSRLSGEASLERARGEWRRYLPPDFQKPAVLNDIVARCRLLQGA
ncbi:MAG: nucleotidyl transferase AbiEii/AbiGii toxin family protein [Deltaproteobacteria bacterium]|nr:nucleotidyl transferase AbiEii/AbiGii toxin family protein [Deltaproteobacteria bacterium]